MAIIRPFRAWRYHLHAPYHELLSPPVDVLSPEQLEALYLYPHSSIHVSMPRSTAQAVNTLLKWKETKVLQQDPLPSFYPYFQQFTLFGSPKTYLRKGFFGMVQLNPAAQPPTIIPHEAILKKSLTSRVEVLTNTQLHTTAVHLMYDDPSFELENLLERYIAASLFQTIDQQGVLNQLSMIQNPDDLAYIIEYIKNKTLYIADGHHRMAASEYYFTQYKPKPFAPAAFLPAYITNMRADDVKILPTHRLVKLQFALTFAELLQRAEQWFDILPVGKRKPLYQELANQKNALGLAMGDDLAIIRLKSDVDLDSAIPLNIPSPVKALDYTILHYFIFDKILNYKYEEQTNNNNITYTKDYARAIAKAEQEPLTLACIVNEVILEDLLSVCNANALMPQKSTYFYPKVLNGLVFASINPQDYSTWFDKQYFTLD